MKQELRELTEKIKDLRETLPGLIRSKIAMLSVKPVLGIDMGSRTAKAVATTRSVVGFSIEKCYVCANTDETIYATLRGQLEQGGTGKLPASFSISDEKVEVHEFRLPSLPKAELATAIEWEVKKAVASPEYVYNDVLTFPSPQGFDVQCVVAGKDVVQARFNEGKSLGIVPRFLETESSALLACAEATFPKRKMDRIAIVDLGYSSFRIIFVHNSRVSFTRALYFGIASIAQQAGAQLGMAAAELEPVLFDLGKGEAETKSPQLQALERLFQESLYGLSEEFRRSEFYVRDQKGLEEVEELFICGGGACFPSVTEYLSRHLSEKKISILDPFKAANKLPEVQVSSGPMWACAVGLSLRSSR